MTSEPSPSWLDLLEPRFASRGGAERTPDEIAADRETLRANARAWAVDRPERERLALGMELAREAVLVVEILRDPHDGTPESHLSARAYGAEAILALAGKAAAKKALLELAMREGGARASWFQVACARVLTHAFGRARLSSWTEKEGLGPSQLSRVYEAESDLHGGFRNCQFTPRHGFAGSAGSTSLNVPRHRFELLSWSLDRALGEPEADFGPGSLLGGDGFARLCVQASESCKARALARELQERVPPAASPGVAPPRL